MGMARHIRQVLLPHVSCCLMGMPTRLETQSQDTREKAQDQVELEDEVAVVEEEDIFGG